MSDNYGFDFNNDNKVSWEESHLTYQIERETARNNSLYDATHRNSHKRSEPSDKKNTTDNSKDGFGLIHVILLSSAIGWIWFFINLATGR